ncbi:hypothetical protein ACIBCN_41405 [Nocardia sp. NPDC051052]|uniref:hypothetical protein n=1 Tax=Nocardia sp. NPDC051052 TaxID=3364322 RepID=UPI00379086BF
MSIAQLEFGIAAAVLHSHMIEPDSDPLDGIPVEVREAVGCFDLDTAGGCG